MTFASATTSRKNLCPRFWVSIQGIQPVFVPQAIPSVLSVLADRSQLIVVTPGGIVPGESRLDLDALAESGASLTVALRDTAGHALRALFASRTRRATWITSSIDPVDTGDITVADASVLPSSGTMYLGAETITWSSNDGVDTLSGIGRARFDSRGQAHLSGSNDGAGVWLVPPNWIGRRVALEAVYLDDTGAVSEHATLGVFRLEAHPQYLGGDAWELRCSSMHEYFRNARVYVGQREAKIPGTGGGFEIGGSSVDIDLSASEAALFAVGGIETHARLTLASDRTTLPVVTGSDVSSVTVSSSSGPVFDGAGLDNQTRLIGVIASIQHVAYLTGDPARLTLTMLLSKLGDGTNSAAYDTLPGRLRTSFGAEDWRFGAGIDASDVDVESFEALTGQGSTWTVFIDEEVRVEEILGEMCRALRCFWYVSVAGKLSVAKLRDRSSISATATTLVALDDSALVDTESEGAEVAQGPVAHSAKLTANYDGLSRKFLGSVDVVDQELKDLFPEDDSTIDVTSKFLSLATDSFRATLERAATMVRANPMQVDDAQVMLRRSSLATVRPRVSLPHQFGWQAAEVAVGQIVRVTNARVPDMRGSTVGATAGQGDCLVLGKQIDIDSGVVHLRLLLLDRGFRVAPVGVVASWDGGTNTATLSNTDATGASPGSSFAVGWDVELVDVSPTPNVVDNTLAITARTATTITFNATPLFTPAAGDLVLPIVALGLPVAVSGYAPADFTYQVPDTGTLGVSGVEDPRWG